MRLLVLLFLTGCFGRLELEGPAPNFGGPFDEQRAQSLWLVIADRESWPAFPGYDGIFENAAPHGSFGRIHVNAIASEAPSELPIGSLIVKHDYETDEAITSITAIERVDNFNPDAFDWFWARFTLEGELALDDDGNPLGGAIEPGCIDCHRSAPGDDFVFLNGEP